MDMRQTSQVFKASEVLFVNDESNLKRCFTDAIAHITYCFYVHKFYYLSDGIGF